MLSTKDFFKKASSRCGNLDEGAVRAVYSALAKTLLGELKGGESIMLPKLGIFELRFFTERGEIVKYVYFNPNNEMKYYINS